MKLISIKCPSCGATVKYNKKDDSVICTYCKSQIVIQENKETYHNQKK